MVDRQEGLDTSQWIELRAGVPWCPPDKLNRIARQQGLCLAIAQASVYDEICQAVPFSSDEEQQLTQLYLQEQGITEQAELEPFLNHKGWNQDDLIYFATKGYRVARFQDLVFGEEVELRFLNRKLDLDQVTYSLIRVKDGNLAFELHQQLLEGEASFEDLAKRYSEGSERESGGRHGPYPLSQAHAQVAEKLRTSQPGQLWPPFFLVDIWVILRLDSWDSARLNDDAREQLLDELFSEWLQQRVMTLLAGQQPSALPHHLLNGS